MARCCCAQTRRVSSLYGPVTVEDEVRDYTGAAPEGKV